MGRDALAHQIIPLVEALESLGADADRALALAGLQRSQLENPSNRLDDTVERRIWDAAVDVTGDPQIGLKLAPQIRHGTLGAYEYLLRNAGTLGEAIEWGDRYMRLVDTRTRIAVRTEDDSAIARVWRSDDSELVPAALECLFGVFALLCREHFPADLGLQYVNLVHQPIGELSTYEETFRCPVRFGAIAYELAMPEAALQSRMRGADPGLGQVLHQHVEDLLQAAPPLDAVVEDARRLLSERLANGTFAVEDLARAMHVSPRTLRRRLEAAQTSYTALLDDVRRERAAHDVARTDVPLAEVARLLGYSDASTFYRAFKRWTDVTPAQYRRRARQDLESAG